MSTPIELEKMRNTLVGERMEYERRIKELEDQRREEEQIFADVVAERDVYEAELAKTQEALRPFAGLAENFGSSPDDTPLKLPGLSVGDFRRARAALGTDA